MASSVVFAWVVNFDVRGSRVRHWNLCLNKGPRRGLRRTHINW